MFHCIFDSPVSLNICIPSLFCKWSTSTKLSIQALINVFPAWIYLLIIKTCLLFYSYLFNITDSFYFCNCIHNHSKYLNKYIRIATVFFIIINNKISSRILQVILKDCVRYIFASLFCMSKRRTCETRKNVFYLTLKALFALEIINFKFSDIQLSRHYQMPKHEARNMFYSITWEVSTVW